VAPSCRRPKVRRSRRQHSRCRHPIPASPPSGVLPFPAYHSSPSTAGLSRVRPPSSNREVGTLSDSALEPSSRRPAPNQRLAVGSVRGLGFGVTPRALVSMRERTRPSTPLLVVRRSHPSFRPLRSVPSERRPFDDRADEKVPQSKLSFLLVGSIVKSHVPKREGPSTEVEHPLSRLATLPSKVLTAKVSRRPSVTPTVSASGVLLQAPFATERHTNGECLGRSA
jgi:hypothetical protein